MGMARSDNRADPLIYQLQAEIMHPPRRADSNCVVPGRSQDSGAVSNNQVLPGSMMLGRKTRQLVPLASGVGLLTFPYFIAESMDLLVICLVLAALPLIIRST